MSFEVLKKHKTFNGETVFAKHPSSCTKTDMKFSYFKPAAEKLDSAIIWLSGLTCTEENFITKAGSQFYLADTTCLIVCPDTSPRGLDLPQEHESYDFGSGAGFYLNATTDGFRDHYNMYDYILKELVPLVQQTFGIDQLSISGHSMGGHGALVLGLRNPDVFKAVSAFSPIVNPTQCAWGEKAFQGYLGTDKSNWSQYDACELLRAGNTRSDTILVDQGLADEFLEKQLLTENFKLACQETGQDLNLNYREGYDHSYYFISSFIEQHINFLRSK